MSSSPDTNTIKVSNTAIAGKIGEPLLTDALEITDLEKRLSAAKAKGGGFNERQGAVKAKGWEKYEIKFSTKPELPSWLELDPSTGTLKGCPPPNAQKLFKFKFECYAIFLDNTEEKLGDSADVTITIARDPTDASSDDLTSGDWDEINQVRNRAKVESAGSDSSVSLNGVTTRVTMTALNTVVNTTAANLSGTFQGLTASTQVIGAHFSYSNIAYSKTDTSNILTSAKHHLETSGESTRTYGPNAITFDKTYGPLLSIKAGYATHDKKAKVGGIDVSEGSTIVKNAPVHWVKLPLCEEKVRESLRGIVKFAETAREVLYMQGWVAAANQQMPGLDLVGFGSLKKGTIEYQRAATPWADAGKPDTLVPLALSVKSPGAQQIDFLGNGVRKFTIGSATYLYFGGVISNIYATGTTLAAETMHTTIQSEFIQYFKCKPPLKTFTGSESLYVNDFGGEEEVVSGGDGPQSYKQQLKALDEEPGLHDDIKWATEIIKADHQILGKLKSAKSHLPEVRKLVGSKELGAPIVVKNLVEGTYGIASVTESDEPLSDEFQWESGREAKDQNARGLSKYSPHQLFEMFNAAERNEKFLAKSSDWDPASVTIEGNKSPRTRTRLVSPNMYFVGMVNTGEKIEKEFFAWNANVNAEKIGAVDYLTTSPSTPDQNALNEIPEPVDFAISGQASGLAFFGRRDLRLLSNSKLHLLGKNDVTLTSHTCVNVTANDGNLVLDSKGFTAKVANFTINGQDFVVRGIAAGATEEMLAAQKEMNVMLAKKKELDEILEQERKKLKIYNDRKLTVKDPKAFIEMDKKSIDPSYSCNLFS